MRFALAVKVEGEKLMTVGGESEAATCRGIRESRMRRRVFMSDVP